MTVLPYIVIGGIAFYYLYENYHPDKITTVPDIDIKQEIKKQQENIPIVADETKMVRPKLLPIPVFSKTGVPNIQTNPNITMSPHRKIQKTYEGTSIVRNPLLTSSIINPNMNNMNNSWNKGGPVFARMPNMRTNPNMHSPFTRAIHKNYIVAKF